MATTYHDPDGRVAAYVLQGRTDGSGVEAEGEHVDGQDLRLLSQFLTAGVKDAAAFQVRERQAGATMSVDVGSGTVGDVAVIAGADPLQGNYIVGWPEAVTNVAIGAADLSNPRIDEIYLVVQDHTYDHNGANIVPRLAVRDGTPSSSPTPPGPDPSWKAYLLLATVNVRAGVTEIEDGDITDERQIVELADDIVATDSIRTAAVTTEKIATGAVNTSKIATGAVTTAKIADAAITPAKIADGAVNARTIRDGNVNTPKIADRAVTALKIAGDAISGFVRMAGTSGSPSLSTSDAELLSASVSIPASWNTWSVVVTATGRYSISGSVERVRLYLRVPGAQGDSPFFDYDFTPDGNSMPCALTHHRSGRTSTGTQTFSLRGSKTGSGTVLLVATTMSVIVLRES